MHACRKLTALVDGNRIAAVGLRLVADLKVAVRPEFQKATIEGNSNGKTVLYAATDGRVSGSFAVEDDIQPESKEAVTELHRLGIRVAMITGDSKLVIRKLLRYRFTSVPSRGHPSVDRELRTDPTRARSSTAVSSSQSSARAKR